MGQLRFVAMEHTRTQRAGLVHVLGMVESGSGVHALSKINNRGRTFSLQFYDEDSEEWVTEASAKAGSKGSAILQLDDIWTPDENCYDDWSFLYRIVSEKAAGKKRLESNEIQIDFYSGCYSQ